MGIGRFQALEVAGESHCRAAARIVEGRIEDLRRAGKRWVGSDVVDVVPLDVLVKEPHSAADHQLAARPWLPGESEAGLKVGPVVFDEPPRHLLAANPDAVQIRMGREVRELALTVEDRGRQGLVEEFFNEYRRIVVPFVGVRHSIPPQAQVQRETLSDLPVVTYK